MANIFPRHANWLPLKLVFCLGLIGAFIVLGIWYYFTPKYTRVGYMPIQPISFSHEIHAGQLGMDCRYCHSFVDQAAHANVPTSETCHNCHRQGGVQWENSKLAVLKESVETGEPIRWTRIHELPDYAYFNHSAHVNRGVSCASCHGKINEMPVVYHAKPLSMSWCLECHRHPESFIRPLENVYDLDWTIEEEKKKPGSPYANMSQEEMGQLLVTEWNVHPPVNCAGCHR